MIPQAIGFFGWKRPQIAAGTLAALARCHGEEPQQQALLAALRNLQLMRR